MKLPSLQDVAVATKQVASKSAANPIQWICGLTTPASIAAACLTGSPLNICFFILALIPVLYFIRAYEFFMKSDPDRLQSERFLLERQVVARMGTNDGTGNQILLPSEPNVSNPALDHGEDDA